jgi:hypothetical protein
LFLYKRCSGIALISGSGFLLPRGSYVFDSKYSLVNCKNRKGSFGLKCRVSSHSFGFGLFLGFKERVYKYFTLFVPAGCPLELLPLFVLIEFISYLARFVLNGLII